MTSQYSTTLSHITSLPDTVQPYYRCKGSWAPSLQEERVCKAKQRYQKRHIPKVITCQFSDRVEVPQGDMRLVPAGKIRARGSEAVRTTGGRLLISVQQLGSPNTAITSSCSASRSFTNTDTLYARTTTTSLLSSQQLQWGPRLWCFLRVHVALTHVWESVHLRTEEN